MTLINSITQFSATNTDEVFFAFASSPGESFSVEVDQIIEKYSSLQEEQGCSEGTEVMLRFHLSDVSTQAEVLREMIGGRCSFVSFIGQPPVNGSRLALEAYHVKTPQKLDKDIIDEDNAHELYVKLKNYELFYHRRRNLKAEHSFPQAQEECKALSDALTKHGATIRENCVRTWFYSRDIDNNYTGLVDARREYFKAIGMTKDTHYIASTGIEGQCEDPHRLVGLDALNVFGLEESQTEFMQALNFMPPTHAYGVTFERGTRLIYGDRSHYYISGTASIDAEGNVMHPGDVRAQTRRMIETVDALLINHGSNIRDMKIANVYLRDSSDAPTVSAVLNEMLPQNLPRILVKASVCRPGWLVEMDGIAVNANGDDTFKPYT